MTRSEWQTNRTQSAMTSQHHARTSCRIFVVASFCVVAMIAYLSRNCLSVFAADEAFRAELNVTKDQLSNVMTAFFIAYGIFQIPAGWLGQRYGSRIVLTVYSAAWGLCTVVLGMGSTWGFLAGAMFANGMAQAGVFPNAARSISDWMPGHRKAVACGFMAAFMSIGGAGASAMTGWLSGEGVPWQWIVGAYSVPSLLWAGAFYYWFRDRPAEHPGVNDAELDWISGDTPDSDSEASRETAARAGIEWRLMLTSKNLWLINGQQFFRAAGYIFFATWFPTYLRETHGVSVKDAGLLSSLPLLAVVLGCSLGGILTDALLQNTGSRAISRKYVAASCLAICGLLTVSAMAAETLRGAMTLISAGSFFAAVAGPCSYAQTMDLAGKQIPVVFGMMNMMGNFGAAVCPQLVTRTVNLTGSWQSVLFLFLLIYLAGAVCWVMLDVDAILEESSPEAIETEAPESS